MRAAVHILLALTIASAVVLGLLLSQKRAPRPRPPMAIRAGAPIAATSPTATAMTGAYGPAPAFSLKERSGRSFSSEELRGQVWIADFIFTRCADLCPRMTARLQKVLAELGDAPDLKLVSFTMDPTYDTPEVLAKYADAREAPKDRWLFLTFDDTQTMERLSKEGFKLSASANPSDVIHSSRFILVDRRGQIRGHFDAEERDEVIVLRELVAETRKALAEPRP